MHIIQDDHRTKECCLGAQCGLGDVILTIEQGEVDSIVFHSGVIKPIFPC